MRQSLMGNGGQAMLRALWRLAILTIASSAMLGCSPTLEQLPVTAAAAFALDPQAPERGRWVEELTVQASIPQALTAAQEALAAVRFIIEAPASTAERRCGSRAGSQDEGTTWACFYVRREAPDRTAVRLVMASRQAFSAITGTQAYPDELIAAFRERLAGLQGG